jgi:hypothetical protein
LTWAMFYGKSVIYYFMCFDHIVCFLCNPCLKRCLDELVVLFSDTFAVICLCMLFYILYDRYKNELEKTDKEKLLIARNTIWYVIFVLSSVDISRYCLLFRVDRNLLSLIFYLLGHRLLQKYGGNLGVAATGVKRVQMC